MLKHPLFKMYNFGRHSSLNIFFFNFDLPNEMQSRKFRTKYMCVLCIYIYIHNVWKYLYILNIYSRIKSQIILVRRKDDHLKAKTYQVYSVSI